MNQTTIKPNANILNHLPDDLPKPNYNRDNVTVGIVHVGVGGFHRAHQAVYIDQLIALGNHNNWGICGIGLLESDIGMKDALTSQDCLYTLIQKDKNIYQPSIVGSMVEFIHAPTNPDVFMQRLIHPDTKIVSLTITEGGYCFDDVTGDFLENHPPIVHDLENPDSPISVFGYISNALSIRKEKGLPAFTIMSCDNIQTNGDIAKRMFLSFARLKDPVLADWMQENVCFPNSMVDRITPATTADDKSELLQQSNIDDQWPVVTEPFIQWVLEDSFSNGRPAFERVGVQLTNDVLPYEKMKIRLLNASHQLIGFLGLISGLTYVHEVLNNPTFSAIVRALMDESTHILDPVPGVNLNDYKNSLIQRFSNPTINDQLTRICTDTSARMPKFLLPSVEDAINQGKSLTFLSFSVACWIRFWLGKDEANQTYTMSDQFLDLLTNKAVISQDNPREFITLSQLFSPTIQSNAMFCDLVSKHLISIKKLGIEKSCNTLLSL